VKVLFVHNGLGTGGAERSLAELLPGLAEAGITPIVACLYRRNEGMERAVLERGFDVRFLRARRTLSRALEIRKLIRRERPDVVHTTIFEANVSGRLAAAGTGAVVVSSLVNTPWGAGRALDPNVRRPKVVAAQRIDAFTARHLTDHFHAITHAVRDWAVETLGLRPERITVIERGRDPERLGEPGAGRRAKARGSLGLTPDDEVILAVGRQEYQKGHRYLLEAMPGLLERRPNVVLLVAGRKGNASAELERLLAGLDPARVRLLGHRDDVPDLLAAADVFAFPSLYEGLGGSLLEAMALALPIVASDVPAIREVLDGGACGLLVPTASPAELGVAIERLLGDDGLRAGLAERGRARFLERYTLMRSTARMVELYRGLVAPVAAMIGGA
jgi:glycosyltransferase involved in cell wall biosynthesis